MFAGVDLAASPRGVSGVVVLEQGRGGAARLLACAEARFSDEELLELLTLHGPPAAVVFDAPLWGGEAVDGFRPVERLVLRLGGRLLPLKLASMRALARRGLRLAARVKVFSEVFETHPRSFLRIGGCGVDAVARRLGVDAAALRGCGRHSLDAFAAAAAAALLRSGLVYVLAGERFGFLVPLRGLCTRL
ncbi:MAG: hypothetical protein GXO15_02970 [Crenarchaeota archaeon]|nr:hypothetical protein [Thermoproteota archaeon]